MLIISILALAILGIATAATLFRDTFLLNLAWEIQFELEEDWNLIEVEAAPDGSIWVLVEKDVPYSAELQNLQDGEAVQVVQLAEEPVLRAELALNEGFIGPVISMAIDNSSGLWLNTGSSEMFVWNGERWFAGDYSQSTGNGIDELEFGAGVLWALLRDQSGIVAIDPSTGAGQVYPLEFDFPDAAVELRPEMISPILDGGIVISGVMNPGGTGLLSIDQQGNPALVTYIPNPESVGAKNIQLLEIPREEFTFSRHQVVRRLKVLWSQ